VYKSQVLGAGGGHGTVSCVRFERLARGTRVDRAKKLGKRGVVGVRAAP